MRVLVTGAAGNLGGVICRTFVEDWCSVRVLLHKKKVRNLGDNLEIVWGDITQPEQVREALDGVDAVVHLAGMVPPFTEQKPELARRVNVGGTRTIVELTKEKGGSIPFVFTSSAAVFGPCPDTAECLNPDNAPCNPISVYAKTKVAAENLIKESGVDYVILRLTSIPYPKIRLSDVKTHLFTIPLGNKIEFCHPNDVALAIRNAVKDFDKVKGNTLMIAGGPSQQMRYEDMLRVFLGTFGLPVPPRHKFAEEPFELHWYDTVRSQELLQFQCKTLYDYSEDLARQFPAPIIALMRRIIGPVFGRLIVRLM